MLSDTHSELVCLALDLSFPVMKTIKKKRNFHIAYLVLYFAAVDVEIE